MSACQRLFFALWPKSSFQENVAQTTGPLLEHTRSRLLPPEKLHITLLFLGSVGAEKQACIEQAASAVEASSFELEFSHVVYRKRQQIIWLEPKEELPEALLQLVQELRAGCRACEVPLEDRPFKAHMTLARKASRPPAADVIPTQPWRVDEFALVASITLPQGAQYEVVKTWRLN